MSKKATQIFIIGTFVTLYLLVSVISTIHVIDFFLMSNPKWLAVSLAIAFEVGAAASLASIITLDKMNKGIVWGLFILLTAMQAMGNTYYTYIHLNNFQGWIELFGLVDEELIYQKRVLSIVSGAILPIVALGFIKALVDYIRPSEELPIVEKPIEVQEESPIETPIEEPKEVEKPIEQSIVEPVIESIPEVKKIETPKLTIEKPQATLVETPAEEPKKEVEKPIETPKRPISPDEAAARGFTPASDRVTFSDRI